MVQKIEERRTGVVGDTKRAVASAGMSTGAIYPYPSLVVNVSQHKVLFNKES